MKTFDEVKAKWLKDPVIKAEYDALGFKYDLISAIIDQRTKKGLSQKDVAEKIGTMQSAIARFESGSHNPTLLFVKKLADALDVKIIVKT